MLLSKLAPLNSRGLRRLIGAQVRTLAAPNAHSRRAALTEAPQPSARRRVGVAGALLAAGMGLGAAWARWGDDGLLPTVEAAKPTSDDVPTSRKTHNFIADVVKSCSHGVVYIEILDGRFNRCGNKLF